MDYFNAFIGWAILVVLLESIMWYIFFRKTVRICFLTEPDLPFSRYFTVSTMRILAITHAAFLIGVILFFHNLLW